MPKFSSPDQYTDFTALQNILSGIVWTNKFLVTTGTSLLQTLIFGHFPWLQSFSPVFNENIKQLSRFKVTNLFFCTKHTPLCMFGLGQNLTLESFQLC